jgi:hypothetical protein
MEQTWRGTGEGDVRHVTRGTCMQATRAARALVACTASAGATSENIAAQLQSKSRRTLGTLLPTTYEWSFSIDLVSRPHICVRQRCGWSTPHRTLGPSTQSSTARGAAFYGSAHALSLSRVGFGSSPLFCRIVTTGTHPKKYTHPRVFSKFP